VISNDVQLLRIDREDISDPEWPIVTDRIKDEYDIVVISDYAKGVIQKRELDKLLMNCPSAKFIADVKPKNSHLCDKMLLIKPNNKEYEEFKKMPRCEYIVKTMGPKGIDLMIRDQYSYRCIYSYETDPVKVFNVTGAGDTVLAILAVCLGSGYDIKEAVGISAECAKYVVTQPGTTTIISSVLSSAIDKICKKD
jgi:D-beta-D-heptose 7-phosphate kinase/D-beta-D-heptose 1-phosphate adenosyltransferase